MKDLRTSRCCIAEEESNKKGVYKVNQIRASALLDKKYVESKLEKILSSEILFIEGYFILGKYDIVEYLLREYDNNGRKIAFNVSAAFICESKKLELKNIFNHCNYIFSTEEEIGKFLGKRINNLDDMCKSFHETLESTDKHRHLILFNADSYQMVSSYDYTSNTYIKEFENNDNKNNSDDSVKDLSGTREGIIYYIFCHYF